MKLLWHFCFCNQQTIILSLPFFFFSTWKIGSKIFREFLPLLLLLPLVVVVLVKELVIFSYSLHRKNFFLSFFSFFFDSNYFTNLYQIWKKRAKLFDFFSANQIILNKRNKRSGKVREECTVKICCYL